MSESVFGLSSVPAEEEGWGDDAPVVNAAHLPSLPEEEDVSYPQVGGVSLSGGVVVLEEDEEWDVDGVPAASEVGVPLAVGEWGEESVVGEGRFVGVGGSVNGGGVAAGVGLPVVSGEGFVPVLENLEEVSFPVVSSVGEGVGLVGVESVGEGEFVGFEEVDVYSVGEGEFVGFEDAEVEGEEVVPVVLGRVLDSGKREVSVKGQQQVARSVGRKGGKSSGRQVMPGGVRLTDRDYGLLVFLARYRMATVGQLARRFETSESALRNRLPRLEKAGFLAWAYTGQTKPKVWTVTETGLRVAGVSLSAPQIKWGTLRHSLGLVDLGITFEMAGEMVVTEREVRAAATRYTPTARMKTAIDLQLALSELRGAGEGESVADLVSRGYTVRVQGRSFGHIPDMVLVRQPFASGLSGSIAIELELNRKTLSEWKAILGAYRDSSAFYQVAYYVMDTEIERALLGVAKAVGADHKIVVVPFSPVDLTAMPSQGLYQ